MQRVEARPPLSEILNLHDFEVRYLLRHTARGFLTPIQRQLRDSRYPRRRGHTILQRRMTRLPTARITPPSTGPYFLISRLERGDFLVLRFLTRQDLVQATDSA